MKKSPTEILSMGDFFGLTKRNTLKDPQEIGSLDFSLLDALWISIG